jgi:hypothetical protein
MSLSFSLSLYMYPVSLSHTHSLLGRNVEGQRAALIDLLLLSLCDQIVTTQMSTFSYVAHALSSTVRCRE